MQLRSRIRARLDETGFTLKEAAEVTGSSPEQLSRLCSDQDMFTLDWLVDLAQGMGLEVEMNAVSPDPRVRDL